MGGDLTYKNIGNNQVELTFLVYRDCNTTTALDGSLTFRVFSAAAVAKGDYTKFTNHIAYLKSSQKVKPEIPNCKIPSGVCVEQGIYVKVITLGNDSVGYHVSWFRNERNDAAITNLEYGAKNCALGKKEPFGSIWYTYIPRKVIKNSSPQFLTKPIPYLCSGKKNVFNPLASDPDKDSMVFSLATPYSPAPACPIIAIDTPYAPGHKNFSKVTYKTGYSLTNPFGGTSSISINATTGEITANPVSSGNYVIAIQVKEYRYNPVTKKTEYVGEVRRDLQFIVGSCPSNFAPQFTADSKGYTRYVYPEDTICFDVEGKDPNDTLYLTATGGVFKGTNSTISSPYATFTNDTGYKVVNGTFCWTPTCDQITFSSPYIVTFNLADNNCNSVYKTYSIYVKTRDIIVPPLIQCINIQSDSTLKLTFYDSVKSQHFKQYKIYRRSGLTGNFTLVDSINSQDTIVRTWVDKKTGKNFGSTVYSYYITAQNTCGLEGLESDTVSSIVASLQKIGDKTAKASWNKHRSKKIWYKIYMDAGSGFVLKDSTQNTSYIYRYCEKSFKVKIQVEDTGCTSNSLPTKSVSLKDVTPPAISQILQNATVLNYTTAQLTFNKSDSADIKYYYIYRAAAGGSYALIDSVKSTSGSNIYTYKDAKLNTSTTSYCYKIKAVDTCGNATIGFSNEHCTSVLKGKAGNLETFLSWNIYKGYTADTVEIQQIVSGKWKAVAYVSNTDTAYNHKNLKCGINYYYRIAYKSASSGYFSVSDTIALKAYDTIIPADVNIKYATVNPTNQSITIGFDKVPDADVKKYEIYYSTDGGSFTLLTTNNGSTGAATINSLTPYKKSYCFRVYAVDSCGSNKSKNSETHCVSQLTGKPLNESVQLNWTKYKGFNVKKYVVKQQSKTSSTIYNTLDSTTDTSYIVKNLQCNVPQSFVIGIIEENGSTIISHSDTVILKPFDTIHPEEVNIRNVSVKNGTSVTITFDKVADPDVKKYDIYYKEVGGSYSKVTTINTPFTSPYTYTHTGLDPVNKTYVYQVYALDSCADNKSLTSETHSEIQLTGKSKNLANTLNWTKYKGFTVKDYVVQKLKSGSWTDISTLTNTDTTFTDTGLSCNVKYYYRIKASENGGDNALTLSDTLAIAPYDTVRPAEVNIRNVSVKNETSITITFDKVADKDVKKYEIYYKENGGSYSKLATINLPFTSPYTYTHTGINTLTKTYSYQVFALDSCADNKSLTSETHTEIQLSGAGKNLSNYLSWSPYKGFKVKNYFVQKLSGKIWKNLADAGTDTTYLDTGLACNVVQYYRVQAFENGGDAAVSFSDSIALTPYDTIKPPQTVIHFVTVTDNNTIKLSWQKSTAKDVKAYKLTRTNDFSADVYIDTIKLDTFYTDDNNVDATLGSYHYQIQAMDSCANNLGKLSDKFSSIYSYDSIFGCEQKIHVKWRIENTWKSGIANFEIYKSVDGGAESYLATVAGNKRIFTDAAINNQHLYTYRVKAIQKNGAAYTAFSNTDSIQTFIPEAPELLSASKITTGITDGQIEIRWKSQLSSPHIKYHDLYYRENGQGSYILLTSKIPASQDTFVHEDINTKTANFEYILISTDSCGNKTDTASPHTTINMDMTVGQLIHDLVWTPYKGFEVDHYNVEQFLGGSWQHVETVSGTDTSLLRFPMPCNVNVYYRVKAVSVDGIEALSDSAGGQALDTIPANPPLVNNATVLNGSTIQLNFRGADSLDVFGYAILRSTDGSDFQPIDFLPINTFGENIIYKDAINTQKNTFCYTVLTLDSCLNFTASDTFCTIQLEGEELNQANQLNWHPFRGYKTNYDLEKWNGTGWSVLQSFSAGDTSVLLKPLACSVAQIYRVTGKEISGSRITRSDTIRLIPFDTILPDAPILHYASVAGNAMQLSWSWDITSDTKFFEIWRKDSTQATYKKIATVKYDSSYLDKTIPDPNRIYNYFIRAIDSCDMSHVSMPSDTQKTIQTRASTLACVPLVWLYWTPYNDLEKGTDNYNIYRADNGGAFKLLTTLDASQLIYTDSAVMEGKSYCYRIEAQDMESGYKSLSASVCIVPQVYPLPKSIDLKRVTVTKTGTTDGEILLEWTPIVSSDIYTLGYNIYVSENGAPAVLLQQIADRNTTSFTHTNINTKVNIYTYEVYPYNVCAKNALVEVPHTAINLDVKNKNLQADLSWNKYEGFVVDHYEIEKSINGNVLKTILNVAPNQTIFSDTNIYCSQVYTYRITAFEKDGYKQFSQSDTVTITAFDTIPPQQSDISVASVSNTSAKLGQVRIDFSTSKDKNRYAYIIYRAVNNAVFAPFDTMYYAFNNPLQFVDGRLDTKNSTYSYFIRAMDSCGNIAMPSDTHRAVLLDVTAMSAYNHLSWSPYIGFRKNASGLPKYVVEKFYDNALGWQQIKTITNGQTTLDDSDIHCNVLYTYRIISYSDFGDVSFSNTDTARAFEHILPIVPDIKLVTVKATGLLKGKAVLTWKPSISTDVAKYLVYRKSSNNNWSLVATLPFSDSTFTDQNLNTYRVSYEYKILAIDSCANLSLDNSEIHQTINLKATAQDSKIELDWNAYQGFGVKEYRLYRNGQLWKVFMPNELTFTDTFVKCKNTYTYNLLAINASDTTVISFSNRDSLQPFDTKAPLPVYLVSASVSKPNHEAEILWTKSPSFDAAGYRLYRKNQIKGNTELVFTSQNPNDTFYKDNSQLTDDRFCYFVQTYDDCENTSIASNNGCLIYLEGKAEEDKNTISWNGYETWAKNVDHYNIYRRDDNNLLTLISTVPALDRTFIDQNLNLITKDFCYQVEAVESTGLGSFNAHSFSTEICLQQQPKIFIPNAFTPGTSLNLNDDFGPKGAYFQRYDMKIFNRWGERVFDTEDSKTWNAKTRSGELLPEGVYLYKITVYGYDGTPHVRDGLVYLLW